jgi:hypothetical protein
MEGRWKEISYSDSEESELASDSDDADAQNIVQQPR